MQLHFQLINNLEEVPLEIIVLSETLLPLRQGSQYARQLFNQQIVGLLLPLFEALNSLIVSGVEQEVTGYTVWVKPQHKRQGELCERHCENNRVWNKFDQVDNDPGAGFPLQSCELLLRFFLIYVDQPFAVTPDVLHALDNGVLHFSPKEFRLEHHGLFFVSEKLFLFDFHFLMVEQEELGLIMVEEGTGESGFSDISYEHDLDYKRRRYERLKIQDWKRTLDTSQKFNSIEQKEEIKMNTCLYLLFIIQGMNQLILNNKLLACLKSQKFQLFCQHCLVITRFDIVQRTFKFKLKMTQILTNVKGVGNNGSNNGQKISFVDSLTECFSEYLGNMFKDFGEVLEKRLEAQERKMRENEGLLVQLMKRLQPRRSEQLTSLASIQDSETSNNKVSRVKSLSINSQTQSKQIFQVNQALKKLQQGIQYLQASLTCLKSKKSIQDPQIQPNRKSSKIQGEDSQAKGHTQAMRSKIDKLATKISRFAQESSISRIQNQGLVKHRIEKSRSLITLSNRRYHPVSCPKQFQYEPFSQKSHIHLQSQIQPSTYNEYSHIHPSQSTLAPNSSSIMFHQNPTKSQQNKMPLINKSKSVLNQLLSMVRDQADANVVMFYLKKGFKTVGEMASGKANQAKVDIIEKDHKDPVQNGARNQLKKQLNHNFSQYFSVKANTLQTHNTIDGNKNSASVCSINNTLTGLQNQVKGMSWIKENYSSVNEAQQGQRGLFQTMNNKSELSLNQNMSRQKRKFQRTSNDQKILLLKGKFRSNY